MKLASLKGPGRDGTLVLVNRALTQAVEATAIAKTMQDALERWDTVSGALGEMATRLEKSGLGGIIDFQHALALGGVDAPLPRAYDWLDGSAYLTHVERVRRARNAGVPESFATDPLMYQGSASDLSGPTDPILALDEDWGIDLEGEIAVITGDVAMGTAAANAAPAVRLVTLLNDVSFRRLIPAELGKGFGFVNGKGATALAPLAITPDELGGAWRDGKLAGRLLCRVNGERLGSPDASADMTFDFHELIAHAAKTRELRAGTLIGSGTVSNRARDAGYACLMEARLVEQVELGSATTSFLRFGDRVRIELLDHEGRAIFGAIEQRVEKYAR